MLLRSTALGGMPIILEHKFDSLKNVLDKAAKLQFPWLHLDEDGAEGSVKAVSKQIQHIIDNYDSIIQATKGDRKVPEE